MNENKFASSGEIRQFFVAFLTTVIIVTCYHFGKSVIDCLEDKSAPRYNIIHCYFHQPEQEDDKEEEDRPTDRTDSGKKAVALARSK